MKRLTRTLTALAQGLLVAAHAVAQMPDNGAPLAGTPWPHIIIGALQGALAVTAHYYNPDGTPARVPWKGKLR